MASDPEKSFLFICGCPRSGTTALWHLLMASPEIFLGVERYAGYMAARRIGSLRSHHYEADQFFQLNDGDTHYKDLSTFHEFTPYFPQARVKYKQARLIGDKIPRLYDDFANLSQRIPNAKVIFIVGNILDVCESYERRNANPDDGWSLGYEYAIRDWNTSLERYLEFEGREFTGHVVEYEALFPHNKPSEPNECLEGIMEFLELQERTEIKRAFAAAGDTAVRLAKKRTQSALPPQATRDILLQADIARYKQLIRD